jgi:chemotaxis protein methyltransferase CheR
VRSVLPLEAPRSLAATANPWRLRDPSPAEFQRLIDLIHRVSGISLNESKRALVVRRLSSRIRELGLESFGAYTELVTADASGAEIVRLLDLIATNETHFFREPQHFEFLDASVYPAWKADADAGKRSRTLRVWSAASSTGQEPYSIAMQLLWNFPAQDGWELDIVATDISTTALDTARAAEWPIERAAEIPELYLQRFMLRGTGERVGRMRATAELRHAVAFERLNLNENQYDVRGTFDLIFCRNVLIYFDAPGRAAVIERLTQRLAAGGLLFVGHAESLHAHRDRLRAVRPTIYARVP